MVNKCPKCDGEMEKGVYGGLWGSLAPWAKGSFYFNWIGPKNTQEKVVAYRCIKCGFIENYIEKK